VDDVSFESGDHLQYSGAGSTAVRRDTVTLLGKATTTRYLLRNLVGCALYKGETLRTTIGLGSHGYRGRNSSFDLMRQQSIADIGFGTLYSGASHAAVQEAAYER